MLPVLLNGVSFYNIIVMYERNIVALHVVFVCKNTQCTCNPVFTAWCEWNRVSQFAISTKHFVHWNKFFMRKVLARLENIYCFIFRTCVKNELLTLYLVWQMKKCILYNKYWWHYYFRVIRTNDILTTITVFLSYRYI